MACSVAACSGEATNEELSPEDDSVSDAEMPAGQSLALDSAHNTRVVEHGLQFESGFYAGSGKPFLLSSHKYVRGDTVFFTPVVTGYGVADGKVAISSSWRIYNASGEMVLEAGNAKVVHRFPAADVRYASFIVPVNKLDSVDASSPHFDVRYELKDRITGKSMEGMYRIHMDRPR